LHAVATPTLRTLQPEILPLEKNLDPEVRGAAIEVLGAFKGNEVILPVLVRALGDKEEIIRQGAAWKLHKLEESRWSEQIVVALLQRLDDPSQDVQKVALETLQFAGSRWARQIIPPIESFLARPRVKENPELRERAEIVLVMLSPSRRHERASQFVGSLGREAREPGLGLFIALLDGHPLPSSLCEEDLLQYRNLPEFWYREARAESALALFEFGLRRCPHQINRLLEELSYDLPKEKAALLILPYVRDERPERKVLAVKALARLGDSGPAIVPSLWPLLNDPEIEVQSAAVDTLGAVGEPRVVVPPFLRLLADRATGDRVRLAVIQQLGEIGLSQAEIIVPALLPILDEEDRFLAGKAAEALGKIGREDAENLVPHLADHPDALASLARFGPLPTEGEQRLLAALGTRDFSYTSITVGPGLGWHWLHQAVREQPDVYRALLSRLKSRESRLDSRYRAAVVSGLARWYVAGLPQPEPQAVPPWKKEALWRHPRAAREHEAFENELARLQQLERPWWLRVAAWEVLAQAVEDLP
jgi:HEAT repeat protein